MILPRVLITLLAACLLSACAPKSETTLKPPPSEPNPEPQVAGDARQRVGELAKAAKEYADGAAKLPGNDVAEGRAQLSQQFALLAQILPMLNGPDMSGDLQQQLRIIESSRGLIAGASKDLSIEPTVDTGLRAAHRALGSIAMRAFGDTPDVAKALDAMRMKVQELDGTSDAIHRLVAAQAVQASAQAITKMSDALTSRLSMAKAN